MSPTTTTLLFVHGIGVRDSAYSVAVKGLHRALAHRPDVDLSFCFWGDTLGATWGEPVPDPPAATAPLPGEEPVDTAVGLWAVLDADPLFEVRLLSSAGPRRRPASPYTTAADPVTIAERLRELSDDEAVRFAATEAGLAEVFPAAVDAVLGATVTRSALARAGELAGDLHAVLARAVVAAAMARAGAGDDPVPLDGRTVSRLVDVVLDGIGGIGLPPGARLGRWVVGFAADRIAGRRGSWAERSTRYAGDVVKYLVRGDDLRSAIAAEVEKAAAKGPVVLVGHSLGGVACIDHLALTGSPAVRAVVTVGSQVSYLYRVGGLPASDFGSGLPGMFPRWFNVHDPRDLLSFPCEDVFASWVTDRIVDNDAPFPRAHSAYFSNGQFHAVLAEALQ